MTHTPTEADGTAALLVSAEIHVDATAQDLYDAVSDLGRSGEWSPECTGGEWVAGEPRRLGSIFRGDNTRGADVVPWAPVVRGPWQTESEVIEAVPGRVFRWCVLDSRRGRQDSVWSYEIEPDPDGGCTLTHRFRLGRMTEGLGGFLSGLDDESRARFLREWNDKLAVEVRASVAGVKKAVEAR